MAKPEDPEAPDMARFFQDWAALWREEARAGSRDPADARAAMAGMMETWRAAMAAWANAIQPAAPRDRATAPRTSAAAAAPDAVDDAVRALTRRIDELEARVAKLESPRRRRG
jgi:hypothetical protein